jgi:hypothetical protein
MNNYLNDSSVRYGFATQEKFVKHMEAAGDTTLTEFFKDWYYGEGYPVYRLYYETDYGDFGKVKLKISQSSSSATVPFFEMHVPVRVWQNGKYTDLKLYNTKQDQWFVIANSRVDKVEFDPDKWLIAKADVVNESPDVSRIGKLQIIPLSSLKVIQVLVPNFSGSETFRLIDVSGRVVQSGLLPSENSQIDTTLLPQGIYLVEVQTKAGRTTEKVFIK